MLRLIQPTDLFFMIAAQKGHDTHLCLEKLLKYLMKDLVDKSAKQVPPDQVIASLVQKSEKLRL